MRNLIRIAAVLAGLCLAGLYLHGSLDRPLSNVGLNYKECARNGLGATFCGGELEAYRARMQKVQASLDQIKARVRQSEANALRSEENAAQRAYEVSPEGRRSAEQTEEAQACKCDPTAVKP